METLWVTYGAIAVLQTLVVLVLVAFNPRVVKCNIVQVFLASLLWPIMWASALIAIVIAVVMVALGNTPACLK